MGDRFYQQQLAATGSAPGKKKAKPAKETKADLLYKLPSLSGLEKLTMSELKALIKAKAFDKPIGVVVEEKRLKAPFIAALEQHVYGDPNDYVNWSKLTIAEMREILCYKPS